MSERTSITAPGASGALSVLAASALRSTLEACARAFMARRAVSFDMQWGTSGAIGKRVNDGETFDLVASAREGLAALQSAGRLRGAIVDIGVSRLALGVRADEPAPDIGTVEKFRDVVLSARSIARGDPAGGGTAGNHLVKVFAEIGVAQAIEPKSILRAGGHAVMTEVAAGRADFGLTQSTEIPAVAGVKIGAYLPDEVQLETVYAMASAEAEHDAANEFLAFVAGREGAAIARSAGFSRA